MASVREYFARTSAGWSSRYHSPRRRMADLDLLLRREQAQGLLGEVLKGRVEKVRIMDVGCGTGDVLDGIDRSGVSVVGTDLVHEMVAAAAGNHRDDRFVVAGLPHLPFRNVSGDVVVSLGVFEYLPDPPAALRAVRRILKPGASLIISFPIRNSLFRMLSNLEIRVERAVFAWRRRLLRKPEVRDAFPVESYRRWSRGEVETLLEGEGFRIRKTVCASYGFWGILGRNGASLALSKRLTRLLRRAPGIAGRLALTMVVLAERAAEGSDPRRQAGVAR